MEIRINRENLSHYDTGGGYRETSADIYIDETSNPRQQRRTVIYETLGALLDPFETNGEFIESLTDALIDALDQLGEK
jgi:hypothetical protein